MEAGALNRRITVERATVTTTDPVGGEVETWGPLGEVWAKVDWISDGERFRAGELAAFVTTRFTIRWGLGVTVEDRIVYEGRVYDVAGVKELGYHEGQEITGGARAEAS